MTVEQHGPLPIQNYWEGREGASPDKIVLHTMVGWIAGADGRFHNAADPQHASAHFGVRIDGTLWQWVQVWDTAYHAGDFTVNLDSIGIEHEDGGDYNGVRPVELYDRSAALVAQFCREYNIPCVRGTGGSGIYDHRDVFKVLGRGAPTACPDALDTDRIIREAAAILKPVVVMIPPVTADVAVLTLPLAPPVDIQHEWARLYAEEGPKAGIRAEIALAQALHETGNFTFSGVAQAAWNNPAGLGVTGAVDVGNRFPTKRDGVIAHYQHLLMYYLPQHSTYCTPPTVDQRHYAHRGYPNDINQLTGHWAVPGVNPVTGETYAGQILKLVPTAKTLLGN